MVRAKIKVLFVVLLCVVGSVLSAVPAQAATTVSITSPTSNATVSGEVFTITGTATAHRKITVKVDGIKVGETTSDGSGNWSLEVTGQSAGVKTIQAEATAQMMYTNVLNAGDFSASRMSIINTLSGEEESSFSIYAAGAFPITWKANPDFTKAYGVAPYLNSGTVWVMDFVTGEVTTTFSLPGAGQRGASVAYNTDGSKVYITDNANTDVIVYDTTTNSQIGPAIGVGDAPHSNIRRPGTNELWLDNSQSNSLSVIDMDTDTVIHTYPVDHSPNGLAFSPDGSTAYFGMDDSGTGSIGVMDASTGNVTDEMPASDVPEFLLVNADGTKLYSSNPGSNTVDVFNLQTMILEDSVTVPTGPWGLALTADESQLWVTSPNLTGGFSGTTISIVNTASNTVENTLVPGNGGPFFIFAAPPEFASASVSINVTGSSSSLADTGINMTLVMLGSAVLLAGGSFATYRMLRH